MSRFQISPTKQWNATGFPLEAGVTYRIVCRAVPDREGRPYMDKAIPCTPDGPVGWKGWLFDRFGRDARSRWNPAGWNRRDRIKRLRVMADRHGRRASFLTVIGCVGRVREDELERHVFVVGSSCMVKPDQSGELHLFSNDWPGDPGLPPEDQPYANNKGGIEVEVSEASG
jgi:hypothetical protein